MKRVIAVLQACALIGGVAVLARSVPAAADHHAVHGTFDLVETTIPAIHKAVDEGLISTEQLVRMYLNRIAAYDGKSTATHLNSYIHLNTRLLDQHAEGE